MKKLSYFALFIVLGFLISCEHKSENCHSNIDFVNNSNKNLYIEYARSWLIDTTLKNYKGASPLLSKADLALPNSTIGLYSRGCWENGFLSTERVVIFVFDEEVLKNTLWDTIKAKNIYLKRYDLSLADVQNANWVITYP